MLLIPFLLAALVFSGAWPATTQGAEKKGKRCDGPFKNKKPTPEQLREVFQQHEAWLKSNPLIKPEGERADFCEAYLKGADLAEANLENADLWRARLQGANLSGARLEGADLSNAWLNDANLSGARLQMAYLSGARLYRANLSKARLGQAWLPGATLQRADLSGARLGKADLSAADLGKANLSEANLYESDLQEATFQQANLRSAVFEPLPESVPVASSFIGAENLSTMRFTRSPVALFELREKLKRAGMRIQERELTYAIKHGQMEKAWRKGGIAEKIESLFSWVLFEITSEWGMEPGRALRLLGWIMLALVPIYSFVATRTNGKGRIWKVFDPARLDKTTEDIDCAPLSVGFLKAIWIGFYFSLMSAFRIGWREINVGNWISRLQPQEYTLQATGWVRVVSGFQSLLSVYLIALWALTYFGRPFE